MTNYMDTFRLRVKRARQNITNFDRVSRNFFEPSPYKVITKIKPRVNDDWLEIHIEIIKDTPRSLGFIFAECIHNLRSVVDNVIWQLGQKHGTPDRISFPVTVHCKYFTPLLTDKTNTLSLLPTKALKVIEELQPYHRGNPQDHPLWILNRLWNDDKHRTPVVVATISNDTVLDVQAGGIGQWFGPMSLDHDFQLMGVAIPKYVKIDPELHFTHEVILKINGQVAGGTNARELLLKLHDFVRDEIVEKFKPFF
ncbi:MAG: hypothetical protein BZY83_07830 [SAR202 cluster bacterium Casp-Chloro-G2]|nr:MAG: hypothetical protein BZY83_07830 [SAR202 cluster bacterium Casp-Chloro-G2]